MSQRSEKVRACLEQDTGINLHAGEVKVTEVDGAIVLEGKVATIADKRRALPAAKAAAGADEVLDRLTIVTVGEARDEELADEVLDALTSERAFGDFELIRGESGGEGKIGVSATGQTVHLVGEVPSLTHRRLAEVLAWWQAGTGDVDNRLHVSPAEQDHDGELHDALLQVLELDPFVEADQITVEVDSGQVKLTGGIVNQEQGGRIVDDCWYVPGVHGVEHNFQVVNLGTSD